MPAFKDVFNRLGATANGWIESRGYFKIRQVGKLEHIYGGQNLYEGWTEDEPTSGTGWTLRDPSIFPHAGWKGGRVIAGATHTYSIDQYLEMGARLDRTDIAVNAGTEKRYAEWEVDGQAYGRKSNDPPNNFKINLLASDIPAGVVGERFIRLLADEASPPTLIDRFRFAEVPFLPFLDNVTFDGSGYAVIARKHAAAPDGTWEMTCKGYGEGPPFGNWGDWFMVLASDTPTGDNSTTTAITASFDMGGFLQVKYINTQGDSINQGSPNANSVEESFEIGNGIAYPDETPRSAEDPWVYRFRVVPTTGVCTIWVNGVDRGSCTIPAGEMARIKDEYDSGAARYMAYGMFPFLFEEHVETFVTVEISGFVPHPPGTVEHKGRRAAFVAPIY